tara:strand:+ start:3732 stop:4112 length:381 start_codon:yes stop_codon:yes gene_type:complete
MKSKLEILEETIEYYTTQQNSRSLNKQGECVYNNEDGSHCAVGRCFTEKYKAQGSDFEFNEYKGVEDLNKKEGKLDSFLSEEYKGHEVKFWNELQQLHDSEYNWKEDFILSEKGNAFARKLIEKYS